VNEITMGSRLKIYMRVLIAAVIPAVAILSARADPILTSVEQKSSGDCSPPIINAGNVTINCPGIGDAASRSLSVQLTEQFKMLNAKIDQQDDSSRTIHNLNDLNDELRRKADDWAKSYLSLKSEMDRIAEQYPKLKDVRSKAEQLLDAGDFVRTRELIQSAQSDFKDVRNEAAELAGLEAITY
jgi:hypothetical protein